MNTTFCTVCSMNVREGSACSDPDCPQLDEGDYVDPEFTDPEELDFTYSSRKSQYEHGYDTTEEIEFSDAEDGDVIRSPEERT